MEEFQHKQRSSVLAYLQHRINLWHEEERRRLARNEQILRDMEQVERRVATITNYLQKMKHTKNEYEDIFMKGVTWSENQERPPSRSVRFPDRPSSREGSLRYHSSASLHQPSTSPRTAHSLSSGNIYATASQNMSNLNTQDSPQSPRALSSGNIHVPVDETVVQDHGNPSEEYEQAVMKSHSYPTVVPSGKTVVPVSKGQDSKVVVYTDMNTSRDEGSLLPEDSVPLRHDSGEYTESISEKAEPLVTLSHNEHLTREPTLNSQAYEELTPKEVQRERRSSFQAAMSLSVPQEQGVVYINRTPSPLSKDHVKQNVESHTKVEKAESRDSNAEDHSAKESTSEHSRASVRSQSKSTDSVRRRRARSLGRHDSRKGIKSSSEDESSRSTSRSQDAYMKLLGLAGIRPTKMEEDNDEIEDMLQNARSAEGNSGQHSERKNDDSSGSSRSRSLDRRAASMRSRSQSLRKSLSEAIPAQIVSKMPARLRKLSSFRMESDTESVSIGLGKAESDEDFGFGD